MIISNADPLNVHLTSDWAGAKVIGLALNCTDIVDAVEISKSLALDGFELSPDDVEAVIRQASSLLRQTAGKMKLNQPQDMESTQQRVQHRTQ